MKPVLAINPLQVTLNETPEVAVRSIYDSALRYTGRVSGKSYKWNKIGDVVMVDTEDADFILSKRLGGRSCCGGVDQDGNKIFVKES